METRTYEGFEIVEDLDCFLILSDRDHVILPKSEDQEWDTEAVENAINYLLKN